MKEYGPDLKPYLLDETLRCTAYAKQSRDEEKPMTRCRNHVMQAQSVCRMHGGKRTETLSAALKRRQLAGYLVAMEVPLPRHDARVDAVAELSRSAAQSIWLKDAMIHIMTHLPNLMELDAKGQSAVHAFVKTAERAMDRSNKVLAEMVRLDLEGKRVELEQAQVGLLLSSLDAAFESVGVRGEQKRKAMQVVAEQLQPE